MLPTESTHQVPTTRGEGQGIDTTTLMQQRKRKGEELLSDTGSRRQTLEHIKADLNQKNYFDIIFTIIFVA